MAEKHAAARGLTLKEAIERHTPKEVWQRYWAIAEEEIPLLIFPDPNVLNMEARGLREGIERTLTAKLRKGELIASGLALPLRPTTRRRDILPELWSRLRLDIRRQEASGDGLKFVELWFREPEPATTERWSATEERPPRQRRSAGRPSMMPELEAEMRRRAASGVLAASLVAESEALAEWAEQRLVGAHVPKPSSIRRQLAKVYRELKAEKKAVKSADKL